jgi:hypothetical protein
MKRPILLLIFLAPTLLFAQWSADPSKNLTLFPGADAGVRYKSGGTVQGCSDGSVYVTWFGLDTLLHVRLLDRNGMDVWAPDLVTFRVPLFPDAGSFTDSHGNLYIHLVRKQPDINGYEFILLKVDKNGKKLFGENGIVFQDPDRNDNMYITRYSVNDQEDVFFSYFRKMGDSTFRIIHRITSYGSLPWGENGLVLQDYINPEIVILRNDGFYVLVKKYIGVHHDDWSYEVSVRRYDLMGIPVWDRDVLVFRGYVQGNFTFLNSGPDGFYMALHPSWIQQISDDGSVGFEGGGLAVINDSTAGVVTPQFAGLNSRGELMVYFSRTDKKGMNPQLYGQLIGEGGQRLWGDAGRPIGIPDFSGIHPDMDLDYLARLCDDTVYLFYRYPPATASNHPSSLRVMAIDGEGRPAWPQPVEVVTERPLISWPQVTEFVNNQAIILWTETTGTKKGILMAQNIRTNGSMGVRSDGARVEMIPRKMQFSYEPETRTIRLQGTVSPERYSLHNSLGQAICAGVVGREIRLPDLPQGIYVLRLYNRAGTTESGKIFIR